MYNYSSFSNKNEFIRYSNFILHAVLNKFIRINNLTNSAVDIAITEYLYKFNQFISKGKFSDSERDVLFDKFKAKNISSYCLKTFEVPIADSLARFLQEQIYILINQTTFGSLTRKEIKTFVVNLTKLEDKQ